MYILLTFFGGGGWFKTLNIFKTKSNVFQCAKITRYEIYTMQRLKATGILNDGTVEYPSEKNGISIVWFTNGNHFSGSYSNSDANSYLLYLSKK